MKNKIVTILIIWLVIATAATSSVAFIYNDKKNLISQEIIAKTNQDKLKTAEIKTKNKAKVLNTKGKIDSPLRNKDEIMADLDQSMEKIIFEEE